MLIVTELYCIAHFCLYVCICVRMFRKDKKMYIACYKDLAEKLPGPPTALLLGDAYMNIQEVSSLL